MTLRPYEVMIILDADLDEETIRAAVERWLQLIESKGAERGHVDFWGKRRLAYEINRKAEGYYVVIQARAEPPAMDELHRVLSLADEVIRHKVLRIPEKVYGPPKAAGAVGGQRIGSSDMATDTNSITISGNITRDPEMRYTPSGVSKVTFGVAVNRSWRNQQTQEWEEQTSFFNVVAWRQLAENVGASLTKGSRVVVSGRLEQRSWETEQGEKRSIVEIVADDVAPSLRFATAEVHKVERSGPGDGGGGGGRRRARGSRPAAARRRRRRQLRRLRRRAVLS